LDIRITLKIRAMKNEFQYEPMMNAAELEFDIPAGV
jgi:hypothetical protein